LRLPKRHAGRVSLFGAVLAAAALLAAGCGKTVIDDQKTEAAIKQNLQGQVGGNVRSVSCPDGQEVEAEATFSCDVRTSEGVVVARLEILNDDADVQIVALDDSGAGSESKGAGSGS